MGRGLRPARLRDPPGAVPPVGCSCCGGSCCRCIAHAASGRKRSPAPIGSAAAGAPRHASRRCCRGSHPGALCVSPRAYVSARRWGGGPGAVGRGSPASPRRRGHQSDGGSERPVGAGQLCRVGSGGGRGFSDGCRRGGSRRRRCACCSHAAAPSHGRRPGGSARGRAAHHCEPRHGAGIAGPVRPRRRRRVSGGGAATASGRHGTRRETSPSASVSAAGCLRGARST